MSDARQLKTISTNVDTLKIPNNNEPFTGGIASALRKEAAKKHTKVDFSTEVHYNDASDGGEERQKIHDEIKFACRLSDRKGADRLARPRMSLLGKPLNYNRGSRRDARYRRLQSRVYNFLERPRGVPAILYHVLVFCMVFTCLALSVFSTIEEYEDQAIEILFHMEIVVVIWFSIEFFLRLWSSGCRSRYQGGVGRFKFLKRPFCIIDIITIAASIVVLALGTSGQVFATSALRGLRFFQILRMVRMDRRGGTWKLLGSVVYAHRQELITTLYIGFLGLIFASFLVYLMEKDVNHRFNNFAQALWWGVITLCTVGYGDMVPETWQGKIIASFCALLGISFFALPAGILGSGFALKVQQQQRQKHMIRRRQPAATLIQSLWRCYAADEHSLSEATWKIHQVPLPSPPPSSKLDPSLQQPSTSRAATRASSSFKHNASFVARLPTIRRHKSQSMHSPANPAIKGGSTTSRGGRGRPINEINASSENLELGQNGRPINTSLSEDSVAETAIAKKNSDAEAFEEENRIVLTNDSAGNFLTACFNNTRRGSFITGFFSPRMGSGNPSLNSINEDEEPRCVQLTNQHKGAIRFIRKMKYFVARRKFKEALKPYDVKDVMEQLKYFAARKSFREAIKPYDVKDVLEQYSVGHADILNRVKHLHFRLDQILGKQGSKAKDVYASKISLASRVVKIERQVDDIETKVDTLIELYMQDRKRLLSLPIVPEPPHSNNPNLPPLPPNPPGGAAALIQSTSGVGHSSLKPKPILIDKQFSEPNSPISKQFDDSAQRRPPMQRGFSDLGSRIKKRVTLSSIPSEYHSNSFVQQHSSGDVVIVVPGMEHEGGGGDGGGGSVGGRGYRGHICIDAEQDIEQNSPKTITESSIIVMEGDENEDSDDEEQEEEEEMDIELDIVEEIEMEVPWSVYDDPDMYGDNDDDTNEDTALLCTNVTKTEIIVTPISPGNSIHDLAHTTDDNRRRHDSNNSRGSNNNTSSAKSKEQMDLLSPDMVPRELSRNPDDM